MAGLIFFSGLSA